VATARNIDSLKDLTSIYPSTRLLPLKLDVLNNEDIKRAFASAIEHFGRIDIVYSNSGIATLGEVESVPDEMARNQFEINFWGASNVAKEAVRIFRDVNKPSGGRLLVASSIAGVNAFPAGGFYSATYVLCPHSGFPELAQIVYCHYRKFAVEGLHEAIAKEIDPSWNIKINLLEIGAFRTPGLDRDRMPISVPHPAYTNAPAASGRQLEFTDETAGSELCAKVVYAVAKDSDAPLRVPVGLDALKVVTARGKESDESVKYAEKFVSILE
jgi:NAD(P)-dependent dehydrogenase (short-subunit alcohol dehydrogenase family)